MAKKAFYVNFGVRIQCSRETFSDELRELPFPHCALSLFRCEGRFWSVVVVSDLYGTLIIGNYRDRIL